MSDTAVEVAIAENAVGPKSVTTPDGTVTQHPLADQIEADKYLKNKTATANPFKSLRSCTVAFGSNV
jgi:hypothetical protein